MKILNRSEICRIADNMHDREYRLSLSEVEAILKVQARETCKEIGRKMMRRSDWEAMRVKLINGEMP